MTFEFDGSEKITGHRLLILTSTLKHLVLGTRPFWGEGEGSLQVTSITYPPVHFWRSLIPLLYGNKNRNLDPEIYLSRKTDRLEITMNCLFTLDGEISATSRIGETSLTVATVEDPNVPTIAPISVDEDLLPTTTVTIPLSHLGRPDGW